MRALHSSTDRAHRFWILILASLLATAALAGCFHDNDDDGGEDDDDDDGDNGTPPDDGNNTPPPEPGEVVVEAMLIGTPDPGLEDPFVIVWNGTNVTFDAANTTIEGGNATSYTVTVNNESILEAGPDDNLSVVHNFDEGGIYWVNLTVEAANDEGVTAMDNATPVLVLVQHRFDFGDVDLDAGTIEGISLNAVANSQTWTEVIPVNAGASGFNATFIIEGDTVSGNSEGSVNFTGASELDADTFSLSEDADVTLTLGSAFGEELGDHEVNVVLTEGRIDFGVLVEVFYGPLPEELIDALRAL